MAPKALVNNTPQLPDLLRVAFFQWDIKKNDIQANFGAVDRLLDASCPYSPHMVVLPEMWTNSFCGSRLLNEAQNLSERLKECAGRARARGIWLATGTMPELSGIFSKSRGKCGGRESDRPRGMRHMNSIHVSKPVLSEVEGGGAPACPGSWHEGLCPPLLRRSLSDREKVFNTMHLIDPSGVIRYAFQKQHMFPNDNEIPFFEPGASIPAPLISGNWHIGAGICFDLRFPEVFRTQMNQGANLFIVPAQFPAARQEHFQLLCRTRALENLAYVVFANRIGCEDNLTFAGGSLVVEPFGGIMAQASSNESFEIVTLDAQRVSALRKIFPFLP